MIVNVTIKKISVTVAAVAQNVCAKLVLMSASVTAVDAIVADAAVVNVAVQRRTDWLFLG